MAMDVQGPAGSMQGGSWQPWQADRGQGSVGRDQDSMASAQRCAGTWLLGERSTMAVTAGC